MKCFAIAGWNSQDWFFPTGNSGPDYGMWITETSLTGLLFLTSILPSLTVTQKVFDDGRRFVPSESKSTVKVMIHNFKESLIY